MTKVTLPKNIRIIASIAGKDILDAIKNKTTISVLISALFLFFFYTFMPIFEQEDLLDIYDAGRSTWIAALENSNPTKVIVHATQDEMQYHISRRGEQELGLVLPKSFDQAVATGGPVQLQGYLLNWIQQNQASKLVSQAEMQISAVVGAPIEISVERLFMLPESTGTGLSRGMGSLLLIMMIGLLLVPNLMLEEKRSRTLDALLVSPASAGQITIGKALTGLFFCFLGLCLITLFNTALIMQWWLMVLAGIGTALFSVALGLFVGAITDKRQQLVFINLLIFPLIIAVFLSIESEFIPAWLGTVARWVPTTMAFDLLRLSFTPHTSLAFVASRISVLLLFIFIFLGLVTWRLRRLDRA